MNLESVEKIETLSIFMICRQETVKSRRSGILPTLKISFNRVPALVVKTFGTVFISLYDFHAYITSKLTAWCAVVYVGDI